MTVRELMEKLASNEVTMDMEVVIQFASVSEYLTGVDEAKVVKLASTGVNDPGGRALALTSSKGSLCFEEG